MNDFRQETIYTPHGEIVCNVHEDEYGNHGLEVLGRLEEGFLLPLSDVELDRLGNPWIYLDDKMIQTICS